MANYTRLIQSRVQAAASQSLIKINVLAAPVQRGGGRKDKLMIYGYARCSTNEDKQDIHRQTRELKQAGAEQIFLEYEHGDAAVKQQLSCLLEQAKAGDTIITLEVPRLARSTRQLCDIIDIVKKKCLKLSIVGSITVDCTNGEERREVYIDARDLQKKRVDQEDLTDQEYQALLYQRGLEKLQDYKRIEVFNSNIDHQSNLIYKKDFDLGDLCIYVNHKIQLSVNKRITEIDEAYEGTSLTVTIIFGDDYKSITEKIKRGG